MDPDDKVRREIARGAPAGIERGSVEPEAVTWRSANATARGLLYRPAHSALGEGAKPPLLVLVHGGPTDQATVGWQPRVSYFVERGWAVLRPDHRGSTGFGRSYWESLEGHWGEYDVIDTADGIRAAGKRGWCDPDRVAVMGGSAGGLTTLLVCALHGAQVCAGVSLFGVTDLFDLAETTHRLESRYLDLLVGELPREAQRYRDRSPVNHAAEIKVPLLMLQGDADPVVPIAQAEQLVDTVRRAGGTVEYHVYEGEGHGWRRPETMTDELERVETFLTRWVLVRRSGSGSGHEVRTPERPGAGRDARRGVPGTEARRGPRGAARARRRRRHARGGADRRCGRARGRQDPVAAVQLSVQVRGEEGPRSPGGARRLDAAKPRRSSPV